MREDTQGSGVEPLTIEIPGGIGRALAVFSFEEEAKIHLLFLRGPEVTPEGCWHVKETSLQELISLLLWGASCSDTERVVLDPIGELWAREGNCLLSMSRGRFIDHLFAALEPLEPKDTSGLLAGHAHDAEDRGC